jgi:hypothetical protein
LTRRDRLGEAERMTVVIVQVERRKDGKSYPVGGSLQVADRARAIRLAHQLAHRDHLSIRAVQRALLADHTIRRSLGQIHHDLASYACEACEPEAFTS